MINCKLGKTNNFTKFCRSFLHSWVRGRKKHSARSLHWVVMQQAKYHFENRRMIYSYFDFGLKNSSFWLPYQRPSSSVDCARELFKGSNGSASLLDCTRKKFFGWKVQIFCDWHHKWSSFRVILAHVAWPRAQPLSQSVSLKFSLETRLESFEPVIDFLAFLVQKLWSKINKLIN